MAETLEQWPVAEETEGKRFKIFISGPPGCFKTRVALGLANNGNRKEPALAVVDTEFGTDQYRGQFPFRFLQENDPATVKAELKKMVANPGEVKTLSFDSFSEYYKALIDEWVERFLARELTSPGYKNEYYTLQPRDYQHINRSASKVIRMLLASKLNLICICQLKDKWENMKVVGSVFDGYKRLPYYFDTIINVNKKGSDSWKAVVDGKDRSGCLKPNQEIPWENDEQIVEYLVGKFGQKLISSPDDPPKKDKKASRPKTSTKKTAEKPNGKSAEVSTEGATTNIKPKEKTAENNSDKKPEAKEETKTETQQEDLPDIDLSGLATRETLTEIVNMKKDAKINNPKAWSKMVAKYNKVNEDGTDSGVPLKTAKDMTESQAKELLRDIAAVQTNPS